MSREEKFYSMCVNLPFEERKDERDEHSVPELIHIAELRDAGSLQDAIDYGKSLMKMYPDNDLIPFMIAHIYYQRMFPDEALQIAIEAIPKCPRKYRLYSVAGLAELDRNRIAEAVVWWCRSVIAQCMVKDFQEHDPFLHLAHTAEIVGSKAESKIFFQMADAIEPSAMRLDQTVLNALSAIKSSWARKPFVDVLKYLDKNHLRG
jgi:hypothetical protein